MSRCRFPLGLALGSDLHPCSADDLTDKALWGFEAGESRLGSNHKAAIDKLRDEIYLDTLLEMEGDEEKAKAWFLKFHRISGSASPEGREKMNAQLARDRGYAVVSHLTFNMEYSGDANNFLDRLVAAQSRGEQDSQDLPREQWPRARSVSIFARSKKGPEPSPDDSQKAKTNSASASAHEKVLKEGVGSASSDSIITGDEFNLNDGFLFLSESSKGRLLLWLWQVLR